MASLTFFPQIYALFCCDRRLRTFLKVVQKICNIHVQNEGGGEGVKSRLNNVKKKCITDEGRLP